MGSGLRGATFDFNEKNNLEKIYQNYFLECARFYDKQSASIIRNWILDFTTFLFFGVLLIFSTPQILIFQTFFIESLLSLSETTKCFFLIFFLDLLVGFHSSKSWEIFLQFILEHFGFQIYQNQNFIAFFVSTFPVFLDTIFKYWIFRYLNKISPSTVATYQAMIE
uniref:Envelope membrane protein n=1 Tax=Udotea flabellum TaxID=170437 RepID=A0A386B1S9_9CHLO|nr:Envelope membrane protein [Udotea flabellum]AYC65666.1 Envelope membrane protein [Udotea flabellum]